jgi:hypothetical protein
MMHIERAKPGCTQRDVAAVRALVQEANLFRYIRAAVQGRSYRHSDAAKRTASCRGSRKKNFLFAGSDAGGERAAAFYSSIGAAKLCGLDPEGYLRYVFERIAEHPINRIDDLLPWRIAA